MLRHAAPTLRTASAGHITAFCLRLAIEASDTMKTCKSRAFTG
nr:MAG TPA: hypothetical protein [Caudoviricetes sp.]